MNQTNKIKILIVDDDIISINIGMQFLSQIGYDADYAESAEEGLKKIKSFKYDLILLDIIMPEISGIEFAAIIKEDEANADIPIIFLTAKNDAETIVQAFEAGGNEYITKPFNNQEFFVRVNNQLVLAEYRKRLKENNLQLEELLKETVSQLLKTERQAAYGEVIQGIIHNLRSPLSVAKGRIEMIAEQDKTINNCGGYEALSKEELINHIKYLSRSHKSVDKAIDRINQMVNSLLVKSSSDNNEENEVFDLNAMIKSELDFYNANMFYKHELTKEIDFYDGELNIRSSTAVISQLFGNILKNAMEELFKVEEPEITVMTGKISNFVYFSIKDNGDGIPEEYLDKIFNPFFTTKPRVKKADDDSPVGTGLGLHFCNKVVNDLGGKIEVISKKGIGTEFKVLLPEYNQH